MEFRNKKLHSFSQTMLNSFTHIRYTFNLLGRGVVMCSFVFSVIKSFELLCKGLGWEWTYNVLIVGKIWVVIKEWAEGSDDVHTDTVTILIRLTGLFKHFYIFYFFYIYFFLLYFIYCTHLCNSI